MRRPCDICGKPAEPEQQIFSRHTGNHYCADIAACDARAARAKKQKAAV